ncbi:MAG TPA: peptidoglycan DD-metalloendopeptidase family protein [Alphaproteobacteria bacterium]
MRRPSAPRPATGGPASRRVALACFILGIAGAPALAQQPQQRLEQIEKAIDAEREAERRLAREAEALARELAALRTRLVELARTLQNGEEALSAAEREVARVEADIASRENKLEQRRTELARLIAGLLRLRRQPPEAALVLPASPIEAVRTARLLGAATPAVEREAAALAREIDDLQTARAEAERRRAEAAQAAERLAADRAALDALVKQRISLQQETEAQRRETAARLSRLSREATDLRELIERLNAERATQEAAERAARAAQEEAERQATERAARGTQVGRLVPPMAAPGQVRSFAQARGQVVLPARGRIALSFGEPGAGGQPHRGITIETRAGAQVVAPYDGHVVFAGPFRAYGLILIIEHTEGYHTLIVGLGRIDATVGQLVAAGEPVGVAGASDTGGPSIYVELRRNGQPIDPLPWLASRNEKVSG